MTDSKKEKKVKAADKNGEVENMSDSNITKKNEDKKYSKSMENVSNKMNGDGSKIVVNGEKDRELSPSEDGDDKKRDAEVVFIQDLGFTVKIVSPGAEPLDIQVTISFFSIEFFVSVLNISLILLKQCT